MPKTRRPTPIMLEVPVTVTGARPATKNDKRELFTEETTTVLVFKDGAVIQLSAAIVVGQLLFLTDKRSKREVVCQVVHKRSHRPTSCYVELEFTEPANDFWGVSFPEPADSTALPPTAEAVEAEETTEDDRNEPVEAPKSEDVAQLKDEVEALRAQLRELKQKQAGEEKKALEEREAQARRLAEAEAAARAAAENEAREKTARALEEARRNARQKEDEHHLLPPEAEEVQARAEARQWEEDSIAAERERKRLDQERKEREEAERAQSEKEKEEKTNARKFGMRLPIGAGAPEAQAQPATTSAAAPSPVAAGKTETEVTDELLPRPALDFSRTPKGLDPNDPYGIYRPVRKGPGKLEVLVGTSVLLLILGGGGFAWYKNWLPFLHRAPKTDVATKTPAGAKPVAGATVPKSAAMPADANAGTAAKEGEASAQAAANSTGSAITAATPAVAEPAPAAGETKPTTNAAETASKPSVDRSDAAKKAEKGPADKKSAAKKEVGANVKSGKNHGKAETSSESKPKPAEDAVASDAPVVPAKLLHAVPPVYPPDAMRGYITGDVRIEAVVDAKGHMGEMKVLVGPAPLRQAAMDALRQYEYAPATQGGKAVVSKVTVTIKFWFDP